MKVFRWFAGLLLVCLMVCGKATASHIMGGSLSFGPKAGSPGFYTIKMLLYYDANSTDNNANSTQIMVSLFQKRNNQRKLDQLLTQVRKEPLLFSNPGCAESRNLGITVVEFSEDVRLSPSDYNDAQGYYISKEMCCLSGAVTNIENEYMVLYTEFPPLSTVNSAPVFEQSMGEILCRNESYALPNPVVDADGDEIRYRLETPFNNATPAVNLDYLNPASPWTNYYSTWKSGYNLASTIPGNPALSIDRTTGVATVKPSQVGLFVYRVVAEEYRGGRKIGETHRDFQVYVIDCPNTTPPPVGLEEFVYPPGITPVVVGGILEVHICVGDTLYLRAETSPLWEYQWQKDGVAIPGANKADITIADEGVYMVEKKFAMSCGTASTISDKFQIVFRSREVVTITPGPVAAFCEGSKVELSSGLSGSGWGYQWSRDGVVVPGFNALSSIEVDEAGEYVVMATNTVTGCKTIDTVQVNKMVLPDARLDLASTTFCEGDSLLLQVGFAASLRYDWYHNGGLLRSGSSAVLYATEAGAYSVEISEAIPGCRVNSDTVLLVRQTPATVEFDTIPPSCVSSSSVINLVATPGGGVFSGNGVVGGQFDVAVAGAGNHVVLYSYTDANGCEVKKTRIAAVNAPPVITMPASVHVLEGDSTTIQANVTGATIYQWTPPDGMGDAQVMQPRVSPAQTTTYSLHAESDGGCFSDADVTVTVFPGVDIPNAFTPNGDADNQTWELKNIDLYPNCAVEIFNRWGTRVFKTVGYRNDWDGAGLPAATYYYVIKLDDQLPVRTGSVSIFR
jgi:gliding motility-associated-like protein